VLNEEEDWDGLVDSAPSPSEVAEVPPVAALPPEPTTPLALPGLTEAPPVPTVEAAAPALPPPCPAAPAGTGAAAVIPAIRIMVIAVKAGRAVMRCLRA